MTKKNRLTWVIILAVFSDNDLKMALKICRKAVLAKVKRK